MAAARLSDPPVRGALLLLAVLGCVAGVAGGVWVATRLFEFGMDLRSLLLAGALIALGIVVVAGVLAAVDSWVDGGPAERPRYARSRPAPFTSRGARR